MTTRLSLFMRAALLSSAAATFASFAAPQTALIPTPPKTEKTPVTDEYHGVSVVDDYRWLENGDDPKVKAWVAAQNAYSQAYFSNLPQRAAIVTFLKKARQQTHVRYSGFQYAGGLLFAMKVDPEKSAATLVVFRNPEDKSSERAVVDLNTLTAGKVFQSSWYKPSLDGTMVGMALGTGGSEDAALYVFNVATGKQIGDPVPRVQFATAGGDMAWTADNRGFYYTRYPQGNERPAQDANFYQQLYYHVLGTSSTQDKYVLGKEFPRIGETALETAHDGKHILVTVEDGDGGKYEHFLLSSDGAATQITHFDDKIVDIQFGADDSLWLLSHAKSDHGELDHLEAGRVTLDDAVRVVPPMDGSIEGTGSPGDMSHFWASAHNLYVTIIDGGPEEILKFDMHGKSEGQVPAPAVASVSTLVPVGGDSFLYSAQTYVQPEQWFRYDGEGHSVALPFKSETGISLDDTEVRREFATSKDGTRIPMTILMRKGTKLDGKNPALVTGYGGYGVSETPYFAGSFGRLWLDRGGILIDTNLRGGADYGESWHAAGNLLKKQNVFDDFAACAQHLIDAGYTSSDHLAFEGGSNGGLLMGAELTQHPQLAKVVLSWVGIYDMLRTELDPNGTFNITEYGTVKDPAQFKALYAYSPYHHVQPGVKYPAVLFITGDNDHRVNPAHSRKMTAELQAATASGLPVMLRTNANAGHGISTDKDEALGETADAYSFLFAQLGIQMPSSP
ncbi:MAG: prolyl oligopeptidase family serine peptidase [Terracidiphilus sp.]